ncbi:MAG: hypothetical protein M3280_00810 [Actinomycetota bacterium]|nr:hypothetical protein [Actinomycetota bacterium]
MTGKPSSTSPTPFERFESLTKRLVQVPKKEIDKKQKDYERKRERQRKTK